MVAEGGFANMRLRDSAIFQLLVKFYHQRRRSSRSFHGHWSRPAVYPHMGKGRGWMFLPLTHRLYVIFLAYLFPHIKFDVAV